jgi:hypothetical protein
MNRRKFLAVAGSATLAGCGGQVEENDGTNATTEETNAQNIQSVIRFRRIL